MSTAGIWSKSKPDVELQYGGRLGEFHGMSSQSHLQHCRVLPPGEFNVMIPELYVALQGAATGEFNGMSFHSHVLHCRVLPLGEFTVMISELHATLQGVIIPSAVLKIVFRHIVYFFLFFNAVLALTSDGFRILSDTLVTSVFIFSPQE